MLGVRKPPVIATNERLRLSIGKRMLYAMLGLLLLLPAFFLTVIAVPLMILSGIADRNLTEVAIGALCLVGGVICLVAVSRLILGHPRRDGRLLSPVFVLVAGLTILSMQVAAILFAPPEWLSGPWPVRVAMAFLFVSFVIGLPYLRRRRQMERRAHTNTSEP